MSEIHPDKRLTVSGSKGVANLAELCGVEPAEAAAALTGLIMPGATGAEMIAFAAVCAAHRLDPLKKEIFAFKSKHTGLWTAGLYFDGWLTIIHRHPDYAGMEITCVENETTKKPHSCTVRILRKSGQVTPAITEYYDECRMASEPWTKWPHRMLRHRAIIQSARVALGFGDVADATEWTDYERGDAGVARRSTRAAAVVDLNRLLADPSGEPPLEPVPDPSPAADPDPPRATETAAGASEPPPARRPVKSRAASQAKAAVPTEADDRPAPKRDAIPLTDADLDDLLA